MKILVVDNHDSFTFNLVHYFETIVDEKVSVIRNTEVDLNSLEAYDLIVLSPGPGLPKETLNLLSICHQCIKLKIPTLGVCLGHQAIWKALGGELSQLKHVKHGEAGDMYIQKEHELFDGINSPIQIAHYHSWVVDDSHIPSGLRVLGRDSNGYIMAFAHVSLPIVGLQFHPESIMTPDGLKLLKNWIAGQ